MPRLEERPGRAKLLLHTPGKILTAIAPEQWLCRPALTRPALAHLNTMKRQLLQQSFATQTRRDFENVSVGEI